MELPITRKQGLVRVAPNIRTYATANAHPTHQWLSANTYGVCHCPDPSGVISVQEAPY